jgi:hypothetical protein
VGRYWQFALPAPVGLGELMAFFMIYGDESGKGEKSDYTSFCGYIGHATEWERVSLEWNNMRLAWGVPPLHMRCVMTPDRPRCEAWAALKTKWGNDWEDKRNDMLNDFGGIVRNSALACIGCVINAAHFRSMPDSHFMRGQKRNPVFLGLYTLLMEGIDKVDRIDKCQAVSLIIDEERQYGNDIYDLLNDMKENTPRVRDRVSAITFARDNEYPGIQMSDMVAYEARNAMVRQLNDKEAPPSQLFALLTRMGVHVPKFWRAEDLDKAAQIINEKEKQ